jgi:hypothetical protein
MKFFLFFLMSCFFGGLLLHKLSMRTMILMLIGLNIFIMIGYFFFHRI